MSEEYEDHEFKLCETTHFDSSAWPEPHCECGLAGDRHQHLTLAAEKQQLEAKINLLRDEEEKLYAERRQLMARLDALEQSEVDAETSTITSEGEWGMKANIELLKRLRTRFLRMRHQKHFDMDGVIKITECGVAMCIAGHTLDLEGYRYNRKAHGWIDPNGKTVDNPMDEAARLLGLAGTQETCQAFFDSSDRDSRKNSKGNGLFYRFDLRTPKQAAAVIDKIIQGVTE